MKVLLVSNLDSRAPFGNFTRPFFLSRALAELGIDVANVAIDPTAIDFGPTARATPKPMWRMAADIARAARRFGPDVIYAHELRPALASLLARWDVPVVADFHSLPSIEFSGFARASNGAGALRLRAASARFRLSEEVVARPSQALVAAGDEIRDELLRRFTPAVTPLVVPNGVDPELLEAPLAPDSPYEPGIRHAVSTLPNSGNPSNSLALEFLVEVAGELAMRTPAVRVNVLGRAHGPGGTRVRYQGLRGLRDAQRDPKVTVAPAEPAAFAAAVIEAVERHLPPVDEADPELSWGRHAPGLRDWLALAAG